MGGEGLSRIRVAHVFRDVADRGSGTLRRVEVLAQSLTKTGGYVRRMWIVLGMVAGLSDAVAWADTAGMDRYGGSAAMTERDSAWASPEQMEQDSMSFKAGLGAGRGPEGDGMGEWSSLAGSGDEGRVADAEVGAAIDAGMTDPESLLVFGSGLFGTSGLCVYRASRLKRGEVGSEGYGFTEIF